jgi:large subunit ribosomal protein L21
MYAIVEIAGQQFKVEKGRTLYTNRLEGDVNAALVLDKVLLVDNDGAVSVGMPTVSGASVKVTILEHLKGEKVIVFKKKRRKGYVKKNGHRQYLTKIQIDEIAA